jgi:hypothetical protein
MINNCAKIHLIFDNLVIGNWENFYLVPSLHIPTLHY